MKELRVSPVRKGERGAAAIIVGLFVLFLGAGFAAIAIDLGHLYVARNELQNAADAGALAGAQALYNDEGTEINLNTNDVAFQTATQNQSERVAVESDYDATDNSGDIQRGHWSFGPDDIEGSSSSRGFYPSDSTVVIVLAGKTDADLDDMDGEGGGDIFINAVRVVTRRRTTPVRSFFAGILGHPSSELSADAVAYRGFAGTIFPGEADLPIVICQESFVEEDFCTTGRMMNSGEGGGSAEGRETGAWTDFAQENEEEGIGDPCQGGTNADDVGDLLETEEGETTRPCGQGNPNFLDSRDVATQGGAVGSAFSNLRDCWKSPYATNERLDPDTHEPLDCNDQPRDEEDPDWEPCQDKIDWYKGTDKTDLGQDGIPDEPWRLTLPVIACGDDNPGPCNRVTGAVTMELVWITQLGEDPHYNDAPDHMGDWKHADPDGEVRWTSTDPENKGFVEHFGLKNSTGNPASYMSKAIYLRPDCEHPDTAGTTGGPNFGVLAKIPVLVK